MPLTDRERSVLEFESNWRRHGALKEVAIRERLGMSAPRYYQILGRLLDNPAAWECDPLLIKRLRRLRDARAAARVRRRVIGR